MEKLILDTIFIDKTVRNSKLAQRVVHLFPDNIEWVDQRPWQSEEGTLSPYQFDRSKRNLYLTEFKGHFFKRCPGSKPGLACCNYFVLNLGLQCNMNCSYCYLQSFINTPVMTIYTNIDKALDELRLIGESHHSQLLRVGTGEVIDSLSMDQLTHYSHHLIEFFRDYPRWQLEFKTKSDQVDQFLHLGPAPNVIVSWSLNPQNIIESEELGTANLSERLAAAEKCRDHGFRVSFHLDPMIWHPQWKENYASLVDSITTKFSPDDIPVLSVGALRFQREQKSMMRERFGFNSWVVRAETFPGEDGKLRYDKSLRQEMFNFIVSRFKSNNPKWNVFFCMESPETWLSSSYGKLPKRVEGLGEFFQHTIIKNKSEVELAHP